VNKKIVIFGEVLFDCFPDGKKTLGGAPFNVAWHLQAFNAHPLLISRVGNDTEGGQILLAMKEWGMQAAGIQRDQFHPTGRVEVSFNQGEPEYDIVENSAWDFIDVKQLPEVSEGFLLYHGSLAQRSQQSQDTLTKLQQQNSAECFVDVNLRPPWIKPELISALTNDAKWLKVNEQELDSFSNLDPEKGETIFSENNNLELVLITRGSNGAQLITKSGFQFHTHPESDVSVVDTVGAGDAFSSIFLLGLLNKWPFEVIMQRASEFASAVVAIRGAVSSDGNFYQKFIDSWGLFN